jgi:surfactin synthase thioesterase subunit
MKFDELYKFLGYSLVCLLGFYIAARSIRFQVGLIEGLVVGKKKEPMKTAKADKEDEEEDEERDEEEEEDEVEAEIKN